MKKKDPVGLPKMQSIERGADMNSHGKCELIGAGYFMEISNGTFPLPFAKFPPCLDGGRSISDRNRFFILPSSARPLELAVIPQPKPSFLSRSPPLPARRKTAIYSVKRSANIRGDRSHTSGPRWIEDAASESLLLMSQKNPADKPHLK